MTRKLIIQDCTSEDASPGPVFQKERLPDELGRNLDTVAKARQWLTNPFNWHEGNITIIKWNGLIPSVSRSHGHRLAMEPWDDGLPMCIVRQQYDRRNGKKEPEEEIVE